MKFTDYPEATVVNDEDLFLISTENGIRKITGEEIINSMGGNRELPKLTKLEIDLFDNSFLTFDEEATSAYLLGNICVFTCKFLLNTSGYRKQLFRLRNPNTGKIVVPVTNNFYPYSYDAVSPYVTHGNYSINQSSLSEGGRQYFTNVRVPSDTSTYYRTITIRDIFMATEEDEKTI